VAARKGAGLDGADDAREARRDVELGSSTIAEATKTYSLAQPAAKKSWRDVLPIHPAAELFPRMSKDELRALGEDILKHGLTSPIAVWRADPNAEGHQLLDGRSRLDALEAVGAAIDVSFVGSKGNPQAKLFIVLKYRHPNADWTRIGVVEPSDRPLGDPYAYVISANIHRRHLTAEQKRDLMAKLIKATPDKSDRQIAETVKVDHKTVGAVRTEQEARGEIPHLETRTDSKGRQQPAKKKRPTLEDFKRGVAAKKAATVPGMPNSMTAPDPLAPDEELALLREFARLFISEHARITCDPKDRDECRMVFNRVKAMLGDAL
jgi:hypothetical protein